MKVLERIADGVIYPYTEARAALSTMRVVEQKPVPRETLTLKPKPKKSRKSKPAISDAKTSPAKSVETLNADLGQVDEPDNS